MLPEFKYSEMKAVMPAIKTLFQTRHYIQCATRCELLLTRSKDEIHPIHQAYLNFYIAMSHDTMAREATMRNRSSELDLAEKHYIAAITALTPSDPQKLEDIQEFQSPTSSTYEDEPNSNRRRASDAASLNSEQSTASSATSFADDDDDDEPLSDCEPSSKKSDHLKHSAPSRSILVDFPTRPKPYRKRPSPIVTSPPMPTQSMHEAQFSTDLSAFISMMQLHLDSVRELKTPAMIPGNRFSFSRSRGSTMSSRPSSRDFSPAHYNESEFDRLQRVRKSMSFRPRFDPSSVQKLCNEALSEL